MICLVGNLPALQVGHQQVAGYGAEWIDESLIRAAEACNRKDFPFVDDIRDGILHYLENRCPLKVFSLEDLFERMRVMLRRIGCQAMADHLKPLSPPVTVSLVGPARDAGNGFELAFFRLLSEEIKLLRASGAETIHFCDLMECVEILNCSKRRARKNNKATRQLAAEITAFLERFDERPTVRKHELHLTLDQ